MVISKKATLSLFTSGLTRRERVHITYWVGDKVNPTVGLDALEQRFSAAGPRPGTGPWNKLYRAARYSPGIEN